VASERFFDTDVGLLVGLLVVAVLMCGPGGDPGAGDVGAVVLVGGVAYAGYVALRWLVGAMGKLAEEIQAWLTRAYQEWLASRATLPEPEPEAPPPLSRDEKAALARQRYEEAVRVLTNAGLEGIELEAGLLRAKQSFLRELDEVMR
jgi:hypothetical protein